MFKDGLREKPQQKEYDVCIIGSGPGGSAAARTLARQGRSTILFEAGNFQPVYSFRNNGLHAMKNLYSNHGKRITEGRTPFAILLGKGLGGATLVNSGISFRPPEKTINGWRDKYQLKDLDYSKLLPYIEEAEKTFHVETVAWEKLGKNNTLFAEGLKKLNWKGSIIPRNTIGCQPCARCFFGCPTGAKQSADKNFLPQSMEAGAEVFFNTSVSQFRQEGQKIAEAAIDVIDPQSHETISQFNIRAKHFVLAAGAIGTAKLLLKNQLANSTGQVGKHFHCHPSIGVLGRFKEEVFGFKSIMQGYYSDEFFESDRILLETFWAPAEAIGMILPGIGAEHVHRMSYFSHLAGSGAMIWDETEGEVYLDQNGLARVKYDLIESDQLRLTKALYAACEPLFAVGAEEVFADNPYLPILKNQTELQALRQKRPNLGSTIVMEGNHAQGTCRMHEDPKLGVINSWGKCHDIKNLWIMDSSVFPEALGVNPQITITALSLRNSEYLNGNFN